MEVGGMSDFSNYVHSIQPFEFNIALNQPSGTITLPIAVGALAFAIWYQNETSVTTNTSTGAASVTLDYKTGIVTATRTGLGAAITVRGVVIDAKSSLVTSVQFGTVTIANNASSGTATVLTTNDSYTACIFLGYTGTVTTFGCSSVLPRIDKSGTTVTATRAASTPTASITCSFCIVEFNSAVLAQNVQNIAHAWTATNITESFSITSVNPNNTLCFYGGGTLANNNARMAMQRGQLVNATTFQIDTNVGALGVAAVYNTSIVEFIPGVFQQAVQRGSIIVSTTSNTATINALGTFGALNFLGQSCSNVAGNYAIDFASLKLTNSTTITASRNTATGSSTGNYEAMDFAIATPTVSILGANILGANIL